MRPRAKMTMLAASASLAAALLAAPAAVGSTVTVGGGNTIRVLESGSERNDIAVSYEAGADVYTVIDRLATLAPSGACAAVDANTATCPGARITRISVDTGGRDDSIVLDQTIANGVTATLDGGRGNDRVDGGNVSGTLRGGSGNDLVTGRGTLRGESGTDTLIGSQSADTLRGGSGRDTLDGGDGADDLGGGSGTDTLLYPAGRVNPVTVTIGSGNDNDGGPEDQTGTRRDTVRGDIEIVAGTISNDVLIGDGSGETLVGLSGDDFLIGNGGNDTLLGFEGNDLMIGGAGSDTLRGGPGNDRLFGKNGHDRLAAGADNDFLHGGRGRDVMKGKTGIDRINAKDGTRDVKINCGPGNNRLERAKWDKGLDPRPRSC